MSNNKIALTSSMRSNLLTLQNTQKLFDKTQDKLSSGYKVNSAMDNPSSYFTAQSLNSRADDLSSLLDSIGQAISTLEVADQGITSLQDLVSQAKAVANSARDTTNTPATVKSKIKFDTDTLRSSLVTSTVTGLSTASGSESSMTVRTGKSTEIKGDFNVNDEMAIGASGLNLANDAGTIKIGDDVYNIDASAGDEKMVSDVLKYNSGAEFKVVALDNTDATHIKASIADKDGNVFQGIDIGTNAVGGGHALAVGQGVTLSADTTITQTIQSDGKTVATLSSSIISRGTDAAAVVDAEGTAVEATFSYDAGAIFSVSNHFPSAAAATKVTLEDDQGNKFDVTLASATDFSTNHQFQLADASTIVVNKDGSATIIGGGTRSAVNTAASATATASAKENTIYVNNTGTVADMADTIQSMIGNDKIKVGVEDGNLQIKTLDTSSVEVTGDFATKFGMDQGTKISIAADDTAESLRQKIAGIDGVTAEFDADGHIVVKSEQGDDMVISGDLADKLGVSGAATNGNNERASYAKQFNDVMDQIDQLVQDTSYKGINLLNGDDLVVNFNENRTSSMELKGVTFNSTGLGFTRVADEWKKAEDIDTALDQVTKATSMLRAQASEFGQSLSTVQIREDFTTNMIKNLTTGADKLVLADTNEEAANLLALQTRQSLATTSLSLANQSAQGVLKLF